MPDQLFPAPYAPCPERRMAWSGTVVIVPFCRREIAIQDQYAARISCRILSIWRFVVGTGSRSERGCCLSSAWPIFSESATLSAGQAGCLPQPHLTSCPPHAAVRASWRSRSEGAGPGPDFSGSSAAAASIVFTVEISDKSPYGLIRTRSRLGRIGT